MHECTKKVVLAGGSGFIGHHLSQYFSDKGYSVSVLSRSSSKSGYVKWDGKTLGDWTNELEGATAVVNLSGKNVNCRFSADNRRRILESRMDAAAVLVDAVNKCSVPPEVFIQSSAVGYYGNGPRECLEESEPGDDFLADVCVKLENVINKADLPGTRIAIFRLGVVLGKDGGAYPLLAKAVSLFLGGALGTGKQNVSWVHIDDVCGMFERAVSDSAMAGVYNAVSPGVTTNAEMMRAFRKEFKRPWSPTVPVFAVKAGAVVIGSNSRLMLGGENVLPGRLINEGYDFKYSDIATALNDLHVRGRN